MIHIGRAGSKLGSFSEEEVRRGLASGRFSLTDLGWKEGMANWAPLSQFPELTAPPEPEPPLPGETSSDEPAQPAEPAGLPWDDRRERGGIKGFWLTARMVLTSPGEAFARMLQAGSLSGPMLFNLIGGWFGMVIAGIYAIVITRLQPAPAKEMTQLQQLFYLSPDMARQALRLYIVMGPVIVTVVVLAFSVIAHLFLMLAGGANKPFHVTLRVMCFSYGSTQLLQALPFCGSPLATVWLMVCCVTGLAIAHGTTTGRAATAVALFVGACIACCVGAVLLVAANYGAR